MVTLPLTLLGVGKPEIRQGFSVQRTELDPCCWIDRCVEFIAGADTFFTMLERDIEWFRGTRLMYGTRHREPRLSGQRERFGTTLPAVVGAMRRTLSAHYDREFTGLFCNFYRDGSDSVAWHADRIGRTEIDPLVAILSLGGPRSFHLRPQDGGTSHRVRLHSGDLLVMGGATQHHWEHAVPKAQQAAPRISVTMRAGGPPLSLVGPV